MAKRYGWNCEVPLVVHTDNRAFVGLGAANSAGKATPSKEKKNDVSAYFSRVGSTNVQKGAIAGKRFWWQRWTRRIKPINSVV